MRRGGATRGASRGCCCRSPLLYLVWSLLPVLVAVLFSFNAGRSRVTWQGFSMRWYYGDPLRSVWHDASLHTALTHTLWLGVLATAITVPLGRGDGARPGPLAGPAPGRGQPRGAGVVRAARDPDRGRRCCSWRPCSSTPLELGTTGQVIGLVTYQLSYPVVIVRARLLTIGTRLRGGGRRPGRLAGRRGAPGAAADAAARRSSPAPCWSSPTSSTTSSSSATSPATPRPSRCR